MATRINVYIGTDNAVVFKSLQYQNPLIDVPANTLTRAQFKFGDFCVDTDDVDALIVFQESATEIKMWPGLIANLTPGSFTGYLTISDEDGTYAWEDFKVTVHDWPTCSSS